MVPKTSSGSLLRTRLMSTSGLLRSLALSSSCACGANKLKCQNFSDKAKHRRRPARAAVVPEVPAPNRAPAQDRDPGPHRHLYLHGARPDSLGGGGWREGVVRVRGSCLPQSKRSFSCLQSEPPCTKPRSPPLRRRVRSREGMCRRRGMYRRRGEALQAYLF